jgi:hypothetical protein
MRNGFGKSVFGLLILAGALGGCRFKGGESFLAVTTPMPEHKGHLGTADWKGDPYAAGGIAEASGGTVILKTYGKGARSNVPGKLDTSFDQPAKGSGQQPGEFTNEARGGFGKSNAPGLQASPSDVNSLPARSGQ